MRSGATGFELVAPDLVSTITTAVESGTSLAPRGPSMAITEDDELIRRKSDRPIPAEPLRLLAVDDDRNYLRRLQIVLTRAGFDVVTATDGDAAIDRKIGRAHV